MLSIVSSTRHQQPAASCVDLAFLLLVCCAPPYLRILQPFAFLLAIRHCPLLLCLSSQRRASFHCPPVDPMGGASKRAYSGSQVNGCCVAAMPLLPGLATPEAWPCARPLPPDALTTGCVGTLQCLCPAHRNTTAIPSKAIIGFEATYMPRQSCC